MKQSHVTLLIISVVISSCISIGLTAFFTMPTTHDRIRDYYMSVNAAEVSPHQLKQRVIGGEKIIIVDVRDPGAYAAGHIEGAINIPASDEDLVAKFTALDKNASIVTYCYTSDCMASRQVGKILVENGMYAQHLNVGYAEREAKEGTGNVFSGGSGACPLTGSAGC